MCSFPPVLLVIEDHDVPVYKVNSDDIDLVRATLDADPLSYAIVFFKEEQTGGLARIIGVPDVYLTILMHECQIFIGIIPLLKCSFKQIGI